MRVEPRHLSKESESVPTMDDIARETDSLDVKTTKRTPYKNDGTHIR